MRIRLSQFALASSLVGLAASLASLVDFLAPVPTFCAETGCATVRASAWAHPLGIPMPIFGIGFFLVMTALAFVARPRLRVAFAIAGGVWAVGLVALQAFEIGAFCRLCMVADTAAIALAVSVIAGARTVRFSWLALPAVGAIAAALALLGAATHAPEPAIAPTVATAPATVVEYVDFECPFCRKLAPALELAVAQARVPVHVVRKMVPLAMHAHAMTAALAWCCADAQGLGDAMAAALFTAPVEDLTPDGCERLATRVGCDLARYRAALADPATRARIARDVADAHAAGASALPTIDIGRARFAGSNHAADELRAAIEHG